MHVENELVEFVIEGEQEYEEVIEEYEEVLMKEEVLEPPRTDWADTTPAQGKPQCITLILNDHWIHMNAMCIYVTCTLWKPHA